MSFTCPRGQPERFSHAFAALVKAFDCKPEKHFGRQVVELRRRELPGCVLRRKLCFWCRVRVLQYDRSLAVWKPYPNGQHCNRIVTLNQLATAVPSEQLSQFVNLRAGGQCELSATGLRFILKHADLAHGFSPWPLLWVC